jgi:hypothetical protein
MKNRFGIGMMIAAMATTWVATTAVARAEEQAARPRAAKVDAEGYRTATRLGGPRRFSRPLRDLAAVKRMAANARMQKDFSAVMDKAGLTHLTAEMLGILQAGDPAVMKDTTFPVGGTIDWMALRNGGRPDIITKVRWGGRAPFPAWEFFIDDGTKGYTFVLPKACANLSISSVGKSPKAEAEAARKAEEARKADEARRAEEARLAEERRRAEEARKAEEARQAELRRPPSCAITTTASYAKGIWTWTVDGAGSAADPAAKSMTVTFTGPTGQPVSVIQNGATVPSLTLTPPFTATVTTRRLAPGTYGVKAVTSRDNNVAPTSTCEASVVIADVDKVDFFVDALFGKERRVREEERGGGLAPFVGGFCAPLLGLKAGPDFKVGSNWRIAPALGFAFNLDESDQSSLFAEVAANYWFTKAFIGTGVGYWDFTHSDTDTPVWFFNAGRELTSTNTGKLLFVVDGRFFLKEFDDTANNYMFWGGLRYIFR